MNKALRAAKTEIAALLKDEYEIREILLNEEGTRAKVKFANKYKYRLLSNNLLGADIFELVNGKWEYLAPAKYVFKAGFEPITRKWNKEWRAGKIPLGGKLLK